MSAEAKLEHIRIEVPFADIGPLTVRVNPWDLASDPPTPAPTYEIAVAPSVTVWMYCVRWSNRPDLIAGCPCAIPPAEPTEEQRKAAEAELQQLYRVKKVPWPAA